MDQRGVCPRRNVMNITINNFTFHVNEMGHEDDEKCENNSRRTIEASSCVCLDNV